MPASRFAEWVGAPTKTPVTRVTRVTGPEHFRIFNDLRPLDLVTQAGISRVTGVTSPSSSRREVNHLTQGRGAELLGTNRTYQRGNPDNPIVKQSADTERIADPARWRDQYAERAAHWEVGGKRPRVEAKRIAWGELENRWNIDHGERVPRDICVGCRRPIEAMPALDLIDGNRVHDAVGNDCLIRHGERWRGAATRALTKIGLARPST